MPIVPAPHRKMRLLDLFCGAGGAAMGYSRAGFTEIVGVDIRPQPRYPFEFHQDDAMDVLKHLVMQWGVGTRWGLSFDAIHASPPCQHYSRTAKILQGKGLTPRDKPLIAPVRLLMEALGKPWVIENVPGAPLGRNVLTLSGQMFGLRVIRRRLFESSLVLLAPDVPTAIGGTNSHRGYSRGAAFVTVGGHNYNVTEGRAAMGIDWMRRAELNDAIPPAYTEFIGRQLLQALRDQP